MSKAYLLAERVSNLEREMEGRLDELGTSLDRADKAINLLVTALKKQTAINEENTKRHINHLIIMEALTKKIEPLFAVTGVVLDEEMNNFLKDILS